jgi:hypothetical protein
MDYSIYIAQITATASTADSRLQLRIVPDMNDIEQQDLPMWPCFFRTEMLMGSVGDFVWVIANSDFTIGFVLGYVNSFTWSSSYSDSSIDSELFEAISSANVTLHGKLLNFTNIKVTYWDASSLHFVDQETGGHYIAFRNGTLHIVTNSEITSKVGDSIFTVSSSEIVASASIIRLNGNVRLGTNPAGHVMVSSGTSGGNSVPSSTVWG